jgi:hypothetical protein
VVTQHTPGPWTVRSYWRKRRAFRRGMPTPPAELEHRIEAAISENRRTIVADVPYGFGNLSDQERAANARLMAAAPDLLDAVRRWLTYDQVDLSDACEYGLNDAGGCIGDAPYETVCPACQLRAAIAEATGGGS